MCFKFLKKEKFQYIKINPKNDFIFRHTQKQKRTNVLLRLGLSRGSHYLLYFNKNDRNASFGHKCVVQTIQVFFIYDHFRLVNGLVFAIFGRYPLTNVVLLGHDFVAQFRKRVHYVPSQ